MGRGVPARAELEEEVDIILGFREVDEVHDVGVVDGFPGLDFILESVDEVLLGQ